ncbi:MAG: hypothetical protein ACPG7F_00685 [Aggregatilineales bacterium]
MSAKLAPGRVTFTKDEIHAVNEAQLVLLGVQPSEIEKMSYELAMRVLAIAGANRKIEAHNMNKAMRK